MYQVYHELRFCFNGEEYKISQNIFESGIKTIIDKEIDNLNYAKQVWISELSKKPAKKSVKVPEKEHEYAEERYR